MDAQGQIRELEPVEPLRDGEIRISAQARKRLKRMPISRRIKFRSLIQQGLSEETAFQYVTPGPNNRANLVKIFDKLRKYQEYDDDLVLEIVSKNDQ